MRCCNDKMTGSDLAVIILLTSIMFIAFTGICFSAYDAHNDPNCNHDCVFVQNPNNILFIYIPMVVVMVLYVVFAIVKYLKS